MRNNYVGDIGDYYKYGLLRHINGLTANDRMPKFKLGVVWYLFTDPCNPNDGNHREFLESKNEKSFSFYDTELYKDLKVFADKNKRFVKEVRERNILPKDTLFFEEPLSLLGLKGGTSEAIEYRKAFRGKWLTNALKETEKASFVFLDPDNGLEVKSNPIHRDKGAKYCFYDEVKCFLERGQSLIIYQHKNLHETALKQKLNRLNEISKQLPSAGFVDCIYFNCFGGRFFFIIATEINKTLVAQRLKSFKKQWGSEIKEI